MQESVKFTLENMDDVLKNLVDFAFDIDKESKVILGIIAKNGPVTETKIASLGKRRTILSRDIIRRRLIFTDLSSDFLTVKKGKKIGNLKDKREKFYSLSFKGFLASLREMPIQENFWIKNYIKLIEKISDDITANALLDHIYFSIVSFMILHSNTKGFLTKFSNPEYELNNNYDTDGSLYKILWNRSTLRIPSEYQEMFAHCVVQFFVSCEVVGTLVKKSLSKKIIKDCKSVDADSYDTLVSTFFSGWINSMFLALNRTPKEILKQSQKDDVDNDEFSFEYIIGEEVDDNIRFMAADELNKRKPKLKINPVNFVNKGLKGYSNSLLTSF